MATAIVDDMEPTRDGTIMEGKIHLSTALSDTYMEMPPRQDAAEVDVRDADTPDAWIKRHPDMVRLTGRHPFNSEPPLKKLQEVGWVTPAALHVVRNHGSVPKLDRHTHAIKVSTPNGELEITMKDLEEGKYGPVVSFPVTFICAGNRRKEQNMTKKTIGFNWGCAGVANSVWTGVRLCDVLISLGIKRVSKECRHVHFSGPLGELPAGEKGEYGTSIDMGWALDRERDVLLAFKQNGEYLTPDHGAPIRSLLPGVIGGRMVKWLSYLIVSSEPSKSHYHFFDNRVLPPHVDAELATKEGWWYKPEYIINHININSAMFEPRHNSYLKLTAPDVPKTIKVAGYGYVGGGLKIIRAEISLDNGQSWEMTDLTRPEDPIAEARGTDKHWCWSWWETEVEVERLKGCQSICCRAVDSNQNSQPLFLTWNVMGMMNNCLFRIMVHHLEDGSGLWFEHPTQPANEVGGWMTEDAGKFAEDLATPVAPGKTGEAPNRPVAGIWKNKLVNIDASTVKAVLQSDKAGKLVTSTEDWLTGGILMEEVEKHADEASSWIVVKGRVYDATPYLDDHPGGSSSILIAAGQDATEDFEAVHSKKAWDMLEDYYIGSLKAAPRIPPSVAAPLQISGSFLKPREMQHLPLVEKIIVNHDTRIFRFGLPHPEMKLGLPTGQHIFLKSKVDGKVVMRPYTPVTDDHTKGHVDLMIKVYFKNVHPRFPDGGKMSQHLDSMAIGDQIEVKGPLGEFVYKGKGHYTWKGKPRQCKNMSMIAGGTGFSLCYQTAYAILLDPEDNTKIKFLFANQTPKDILARELLEGLARQHPHRFELFYTVDRVPDDCDEEWTGDVGFICENMVRERLFPADVGNTCCLMCGPPIMYEKACIPALTAIGYAREDILDG